MAKHSKTTLMPGQIRGVSSATFPLLRSNSLTHDILDLDHRTSFLVAKRFSPYSKSHICLTFRSAIIPFSYPLLSSSHSRTLSRHTIPAIVTTGCQAHFVSPLIMTAFPALTIIITPSRPTSLIEGSPQLSQAVINGSGLDFHVLSGKGTNAAWGE